MPRYNYDSYRDVPPATSAEWRKAYEDAPACHHLFPNIETSPVAEQPSEALDFIARLAAEHVESEVQLVLELESALGAQAPDFPA